MASPSLAPRSLLLDSSEITLSSVAGAASSYEDYLKVPEEEDRRRELLFRQRTLLNNSTCQVLLFNGHYLKWCRGRGRGKQLRYLNLAFVAPQPQRVKVIAWRSLLIALLALLLSVGFALAVLLPLALVAALSFTACLALAYRNSTDRWVFYSRHGQVALFELDNQHRDRARFDALIKLLGARARKAAKGLPSGKDRLAAEVAEHRRLFEQGCVSAADYELAKRRIFRCYRPS